MSTTTVYIPIQVWDKNKKMSYEIFKQSCVGNLDAAKKEAKKLSSEFPLPEFIVRRKNVWITIYKK